MNYKLTIFSIIFIFFCTLWNVNSEYWNFLDNFKKNSSFNVILNIDDSRPLIVSKNQLINLNIDVLLNYTWQINYYISAKNWYIDNYYWTSNLISSKIKFNYTPSLIFDYDMLNLNITDWNFLYKKTIYVISF